MTQAAILRPSTGRKLLYAPPAWRLDASQNNAGGFTYTRSSGNRTGYPDATDFFDSLAANVLPVATPYGFYVEPARTNLFIYTNLRNGTFPNWPSGVASLVGNGITPTLVQYVNRPTASNYREMDVKWTGTLTGNNSISGSLQLRSGLTFTAGLPYSAQLWLKLVSGDLTGIARFEVEMTTRLSGSIIDREVMAFMPDAVLRQQWVRLTPPIGTTGTSLSWHVRAYSLQSGAAGVTLNDPVLRFVMPSLEQANTPSSPIRTDGSTGSRTVEVLQRAVTAPELQQGTLIVRSYIPPWWISGGQSYLYLYNDTGQSRLALRGQNGNGQASLVVGDGVDVIEYGFAPPVVGAINRYAVSWGPSGTKFIANDEVIADTSFVPVPAGASFEQLSAYTHNTTCPILPYQAERYPTETPDLDQLGALQAA